MTFAILRLHPFILVSMPFRTSKFEGYIMKGLNLHGDGLLEGAVSAWPSVWGMALLIISDIYTLRLCHESQMFNCGRPVESEPAP